MAKKYEISFRIYDSENEDWITDGDVEISFEYSGDKTDFDSIVNKAANLIEIYEENNAIEEDELEDKEADKINEAMEKFKEFEN